MLVNGSRAMECTITSVDAVENSGVKSHEGTPEKRNFGLVFAPVIIIGAFFFIGNLEVLAGLGQLTTIWVGGGTIIPWGIIPVAAICNVNPLELARKNFKPVAIGFAATFVVAMFLL